MNHRLGFALLLTVAGSVQSLEVDWLYLSNNASWIERSETLISEQSQLSLPVAQLNLNQFWWQSDATGTQISWAQPQAQGLPQKGAMIAIIGESGLWKIQEVYPDHLVLQRGNNVRYWPQSQWHLLNWNSTNDFGLSLTVSQPNANKTQLHYAWQSFELNAQVRYRLDETEGKAQLHQELIVSNLSDTSFQAAGYSYAQVANQPVVAMRAMVMSEAASTMAAPTASESQGVPTLVSSEPVSLAAHSHLWLPVATIPLTQVARSYQLQWDTRSIGQFPVQSQLTLTSQQPLPDIAGPIKIGVFDQQLAVLESQYRPNTATEAQLNLGQSALVNLQSEQLSEGVWQLTIVNRSKQAASVGLTINHWHKQQSQRLPLDVTVKAEGQEIVNLIQQADGSVQVEKM